MENTTITENEVETVGENASTDSAVEKPATRSQDSENVLPSAPDSTNDEIQALLSDIKEQDKEFHTEMQERTDFLVSQSRNLLSLSALLVLILSFTAGVLLARIVWRKI